MTNQTPGRQPAPIHTDKARRAGGIPPNKSHPLLRRFGAVLAVLGCLCVMLGSAAGWRWRLTCASLPKTT